MADEKVTIEILLKDSASKGIKAVNGAIKSIGATTKSVLGSLTSLKAGLAGIGAGLAIADITRTFTSFDDAMRRVGVTAGATEDQLNALRTQAADLGESTAFSATQAAEGFQFLAQAGLSVEEATKALPQTLNLASAAALDLGEATDIATNVLSGFRLPVEELARVNDVLTKTAASANTNVRELGEAFKNAAPVAKGAGVSIEETSAILGGLANNAIKGAEGGTAFRNIILQLQAATPQATAELDRLGVSVKNSDGSFKKLIPTLQDLATKNIDLVSAEKLFGRETAAAGLAAIGAAKDINVLNADLGKLGEEGFTFASNAAKEMEAGIGGAVRSMISAWDGLKLALGSGFEDGGTRVVREITEALRELIAKVKELAADGTLNEWANNIAATLEQSIEIIKAFGAVFASVGTGFPDGAATIIDAISFIGATIEKLPLYFQEAFAKIDLMISHAKETVLELQQAWANSLFGSEEQQAAVQKSIDAEQARRAAIQETIAVIEKEKAAVDERKFVSLNASKAIVEETKKEVEAKKVVEGEKTQTVATESAKQVEIATQSSKQIQELIRSESTLKKAEYERRINEIDRLEQLGVFSHQRAQDQKAQAEKFFLQRSLEQTKKWVDAVANEYGKDSKEFTQAKAKQLEEENKIYEAVTKTLGSITETETAVMDVATAAGVASSAFDGMANAAENVNQSTKGTNKTILSYTDAMTKSMQQIDRLGVRSAASTLGVTAEYENLIRTVKKLGGETEGLYETSIQDIKEYVQELRKASAQNINVNFTGSGSPTKPLSEKIKDMSNLVGSFVKDSAETALNMDFSQLRTANQVPTTAGSNLGGVKDMGKTNLQYNGKEYPVHGQTDVIQQLQNDLYRQSKMYA